eukprot:5097871-Amphidinium_carterae.1
MSQIDSIAIVCISFTLPLHRQLATRGGYVKQGCGWHSLGGCGLLSCISQSPVGYGASRRPGGMLSHPGPRPRDAPLPSRQTRY